MPDSSFEQKFGRLADTQLNDKLPSLVDYRVGFQVIDKNDEETRAVGIAAFVMNNVWLYIPIFFLEGNLKGYDLMYVKQKDIFVPALDNWIAALSEHGLATLGHNRKDDQGTGKNNNDMFGAPEDVDIYTNSLYEMGKSASKRSNQCTFDEGSIIDKDVWERMCKTAQNASLEGIKPKLSDVLSLGKTAAQVFVNTFLQDPAFFNALSVFHSTTDLEKVAADCVRLIHKEAYSDVGDDVEFFTDLNDEKAPDLKSSEKELLVRNGVFIRDKRTNFSKIFSEEVDSSIIQNPAHPGIYDVFLQDGKYKTYIILFPTCYSQSNVVFRTDSSNTKHLIALVDIDNPKDFIIRNSNEVFGKPSTNVTKSQMEGLESGQKATLQLLKETPRGTSLLFVQSPKCCIHTKLEEHTVDADGNHSIWIQNSAGNTSGENFYDRSRANGKAYVEFVGEQASLHVRGDRLFIPKGTRVFVNVPSYLRDCKEGLKNAKKPSTDKQPAFGSPETIYQMAYKQAGLSTIQVYQDGGLAEVKYDNQTTGLISKIAALQHLVLDHGIQAGQAQTLLKEASREPGHRKGFMIKHAASYDTNAYGNQRKPFMGGPRGSQRSATSGTVQQKRGKPLTGSVDSQNTPMLPQEAIQKATDAAQSGVKEVFDVSIISGLLDKADTMELRKDYITDMIRGMDKVGRMLFLFYWHRDEFEERYGKNELIKLEDTLSNVFESTGDLVLFLKEKTAFSSDSSENLFGNLSEDVATAG